MHELSSPFVMVVFGATGDLTQRKLLPALFHLYQKQALPKHFYLVGFSRRAYSTEQFKEFLKAALQKYYTKHAFNETAWTDFSGRIYYQQGEFEEEQGYRDLIVKLAEFDTHLKACVPRYFYLATPPDKYGSILKHLHQTKLSEGCGPYFAPQGGASTYAEASVDKSKGKQGSGKWTKVMIEKPFGRDVEDAKSLDKLLAKVFKEEQIYRIDHYLGKETVQNILAFRYSNSLFDPVWNRQFIDYVQITIAETLGVETRGNFFEGVGTLRDMAQSHLLELMAAIAMKPKVYTSEGIRQARAEIISSINRIEPKDVADNVVRGQYGSSVILASEARPGSETDSGVVSASRRILPRMTNNIKAYREEVNVDPNSNTETFVALKLTLNDPRWQGVPFYMRTGKRLSRKATEISVVFKQPRYGLFNNSSLSERSESKGKLQSMPSTSSGNNFLTPDILTFRIEPNEGIELCLNAKQTGFHNDFNGIPLSFSYQQNTELPQAYERLLLDAMKGDQTLFTRTDEVASSWEFIGNILEGWSSEKPRFPNYSPGTWGPGEADELIQKDGREWLLK